MTKYEIYKEFRDGMLCAISVAQVPPTQTEHWAAGWKAGKDAMHQKLNEYLASIGVEQMGVLRPAALEAGGGSK